MGGMAETLVTLASRTERPLELPETRFPASPVLQAERLPSGETIAEARRQVVAQ